MVEIIRLHGDPHERTQKLLPWYANGSLEPGEAAAVEAHLADCAECRTDLKLEQALGARIVDLPTDTEPGWAKLRDRVQGSQTAARRASGGGLAALVNRSVPVGWPALAQAGCLMLVFGLGWWLLPHPDARPQYHALGAASAPAAGNVVVIFKPSTTEQDFRAALVRGGARLVDGPTASNAYVLHVSGDRDEALNALRANADVALAEPIDGDDRP